MLLVRTDAPRRGGFPYIRWTVIGLFVGAMVLNYMARSVLGVAAPVILNEQHISSEQYSWVASAFQAGVMFSRWRAICSTGPD